MYNKVLSIISMCQRAGKLSSGEFACEKALQTNQSTLIIIASDSSENTKNKFINKAYFYKIPSVIFSTKEQLSRNIGKVNRSVISINDLGFSNKIQEYIKELKNSDIK